MKPAARKVTLQDVADTSGLSLITVSRALRQPGLVQPGTRERVLETIERIGYLPNLTARSLVSQRSDMVGVVVPILVSSLFAEFAQGVASVLRRGDRQMMLGVSDRSLEREHEAVRTFVARQADAIIVTGLTHSPDCTALLRRFDGPVIETWNLRDDPIDQCVGYDNHAAARAMTEYLLAKGHREIAMVGGDPVDNDQAIDRRDGYLAAMAAAGRPVRPDMQVTVPNPTTIESGGEALLRLLAGPCRPDAIFYQAEIPAHGAMMACLSRGIAVPDDVAIAGFGDLSLSAFLPVPLTTVRIRARQIGQSAAERVIRRLDGLERHEEPADGMRDRRIDVGFEIVERLSA